MQAALTAYSGFPFENLLGIIKKLIRTPRNPLGQLFRRLSEIYSTSEILKKRPMLCNCVEISRNVSEIDYLDINIKSFHISVTGLNDSNEKTTYKNRKSSLKHRSKTPNDDISDSNRVLHSFKTRKWKIC